MDDLQLNIFKLLTDSYYGVGQFYGGAGLKAHPRESQANYRGRQELAYYLNYTAPIVNASVDPIFRDEIRREYKATEKFKQFLEDVDRLGTNLQDYVRRVATKVKLYGVVYILVNNEPEVKDSLAENLKNRVLPFLTDILPVDIEHWQFDDKGKLTEFTYKSVVKADEKAFKTQYYEWTTTTWRVLDEQRKEIRSGEHNLGRIPVVQWFSRNTEPTHMLPPSEFLSVAQTNYHVYQLCSWHTQILRDQTFNVLTMPDVGENEITIGTNNVLTFPPESHHAPSFIAPSAEPANMLTDQIDRLINEMYRMSGIDSVIGVKEAKSGVAKQWDFERTNQKLADFATQCEAAEQDLIGLYELWAKESINYVCEYPRDFKINDILDCLTQAQQALDLNFNSKTFNSEVAKKVLEAYMPNLEPHVYDAIVKELESVAVMIEQNEGYEGDVDGPKGNQDADPAV